MLLGHVDHAVIMEEVELLAQSVSTGPEVFNEIMDLHTKRMKAQREDGKLMYTGKLGGARAIALSNLRMGASHPSREMLYEHAVDCLELQGMREHGCSVDLFLSDLNRLDPPEQDVVMSVFLLAQVRARATYMSMSL